MSDPESKSYLALFAMPRPVKITGRSSSVTNSFVNSIIPVVPPTESEVREALVVLGMIDEICCSYCGDPSTEWDHLRPLVVGQRPTGYISEIRNLVPSCGKCNQSKGNRHWYVWMLGVAKLSPATRGITDLSGRVERLRAFESWGSPTKVDFEATVSPETWQLHWRNHEKLLSAMREAEVTAAQIRAEVAERSEVSRSQASLNSR